MTGSREELREPEFFRWSCPHCGYSVAPNEILTVKKHFNAHALECVRCLYRTETKPTWEEAKAAYRRTHDPAQARPDPVQDTYLVGGPDLKAMSGSVESDRIIQLHFRRKATDADRKWLLEAINAKIAADGSAFPSPTQRPADCGAWLGIETAPKDGANILVCRHLENKSVCEAFWWEGAWRCWDGENHTRTSFIDGYLTHWRPMPAASPMTSTDRGSEA